MVLEARGKLSNTDFVPKASASSETLQPCMHAVCSSSPGLALMESKSNGPSLLVSNHLLGSTPITDFGHLPKQHN